MTQVGEFGQVAPYYAQVLGVGVVWVSLHCAGMCGPIMASLTATTGAWSEPSPARRVAKASAGVLSYQAGRAVTYAVMGGAAGALGALAQGWVRGMTQTAGLVVALLLVLAGIYKLLPARLRAGALATTWSGKAAGVTGGLLQSAMRLAPKNRWLKMMAMGLMMGLLPCMLMFWVLGIAASTASPVHGAGVMVALVAMTTPVLMAAASGSSLLGGRWRSASGVVVAAGMILSGAWMGLIGAAANGWVDHVYFAFELFGEAWTMMLW
ncbi:sulfite exporter TauE/SafE family protein [Lujinxingia litoralis]|nr:sulfite exporter TauE/SafE family protein [Lujinxingia litoralis]